MKARGMIVLVTLPAAVLAGPASAATPREGAYRGRTAAARSVVKFNVVADGRAVRGFVVRVRYRCATNSPVVSATFAPPRSMRVRRGAFSGRDGFVTVRGRFTTRSRAAGTIRVAKRLSSRTVCRGRDTWVARAR